jgi:peptidoglycan/LPS O-acetylase OafA/YrhL
MFQERESSDRAFQINSLDGLRGFAALIVFLSHTSSKEIYLFPFANFTGIGKSAVYLFFVLSSFLLTLQFIRKGAEAKNKKFLINYFLRRFFRIYPLYSLYLLLVLINSLVLWKIFNLNEPIGIPFVLSVEEFFKQLLLIQGKGLTWSILVEFRYYLFIPILALTYSIIFKNKLSPSILLTVTLAILSQVFWVQTRAGLKNEMIIRTSLEQYLPIFFMGSLLALIFFRWQESLLSRNKKVVLAVELLGVLAAIILIFMLPSVSSFIFGKEIKEISVNYYHEQSMLFGIIFGLLWSIVVFSCVAVSGVLRKFFETPFLRYLGFISFSVYLLHLIPISIVESTGVEIPMKGWILLLLIIAMSHISWVLIEKPTSKIRLIDIK